MNLVMVQEICITLQMVKLYTLQIVILEGSTPIEPNDARTNWSGTFTNNNLTVYGSYPNQVGVAYHKPTNELIVLSQNDNSTTMYCRTYSIDKGNFDLSSRLTYVSSEVQATGLVDTPTASTLKTKYLASLSYLGNDGTWAFFGQYQNELVKYNATSNKFLAVATNPSPTTAITGIGGDGNGQVFVSNTNGDIYCTTDGGSNWTDVQGNSYSYMQPGVVGGGAGKKIWTRWGPDFETTNGNYIAYTTTALEKLFHRSHLYMSSSNVAKFEVGHRVALASDPGNPDYMGFVHEKYGSTQVRVTSRLPYPTSNATVINLDTGTTSTGTRYLLMNGNGAVSGLSISDPGYVLIGPGVSISVDFPGTFNDGLAPDTAIPGSAQLKIDVSATANNVTDTFLSNGVTPS